MSQIGIVIPAYEPDQRLVTLLSNLSDHNIMPVIVVNDGSNACFDDVFNQVHHILQGNQGVLLKHDKNQGKGRALKTAFAYLINNKPNIVGCITVDADGQHDIDSIRKVMQALMEHPNNLILGTRNFNGENIPWKSRMGNIITEKIFSYTSGVHVTDTQTGLRGIPIEYMKELLLVNGERFEFEMQMLLKSVNKYDITEIPIKTIYDSVENHQTHFHPFRDSVKIYRLLLGKLVKYTISSLSACVIDLLLFSLLCSKLKNYNLNYYILLATIGARVISVLYNYIINYKVVFSSSNKFHSTILKYIGLAIAQMIVSGMIVTLIATIMPLTNLVVLKILVDTCLFFVSYYIQQRYIF